MVGEDMLLSHSRHLVELGKISHHSLGSSVSHVETCHSLESAIRNALASEVAIAAVVIKVDKSY